MQDIFVKSPQEAQISVFVLLLIIGWNIENIAGLTLNYKKWKHAFLNGRFILLTVIPQFVMGLFFAKTVQWTSLHNFGILHYLPYMNHPFCVFLATFVLLDFGEYFYHLFMHKAGRLWKFHAVHHSDTVVDVSTTLREHPCETFIRNAFTIAWIFLSGAIFWSICLRQIIQLVSNLLAHMNYKLPKKTDRILGILFITPNLHQVHHHYQQPYTESNYGDVLSIWDRLFGTFRELPREQVVFGLDTCMEEDIHSTYLSLLKMPFVSIKKTTGG